MLVFFNKMLTGQMFRSLFIRASPLLHSGSSSALSIFNLCSKFQYFSYIHLTVTTFLFCFFIASVSKLLSPDWQICFCSRAFNCFHSFRPSSTSTGSVYFPFLALFGLKSLLNLCECQCENGSLYCDVHSGCLKQSHCRMCTTQMCTCSIALTACLGRWFVSSRA